MELSAPTMKLLNTVNPQSKGGGIFRSILNILSALSAFLIVVQDSIPDNSYIRAAIASVTGLCVTLQGLTHFTALGNQEPDPPVADPTPVPSIPVYPIYPQTYPQVVPVSPGYGQNAGQITITTSGTNTGPSPFTTEPWHEFQDENPPHGSNTEEEMI